MQRQKAIRIVAIVVAATLLITTVFAGIGSLFLS
jgi:preprotein translocase subunit SecE